MSELFWAEAMLLVVVLVGMPIYSCLAAKRNSHASARLKGLNLPEGSIRGMLALISVGSFVIVLVFGSGADGVKEHFDQIVTAFGTLTGAVIGFYFGNRGTGDSQSNVTPAKPVPSTPDNAIPATGTREAAP